MGFCTNCGKEIDDSFTFCPYCGSPKQSNVSGNLPVKSESTSPEVYKGQDEEDEEDTPIEEYYDITKKHKLLKTKAKYVGGHTMYPAEKNIKTKVIMRNDTIFLEKLSLVIPYSQMITIENSADVGGSFWKRKLHTVIEYDDGVQHQTVILDFGKNLKKMQQAIYVKMIESRSKFNK